MSTTTSPSLRTSFSIPVGKINLAADITIPSAAIGLVLFAHGSGSGRHSSRNRRVAEALNEGQIATVLVDLLTEQEEAIDVETAHLRFDIGLLATRVVGIIDWIQTQPKMNGLTLGLFGASTGAAAALVAAAERPDVVRAVVSRGGRPDLAGEPLTRVLAPTLCIVGSRDRMVMDLNYAALERLPRQTTQKVEIIRGATHLFEEPGTLDQVAVLARGWFRTYLGGHHAL